MQPPGAPRLSANSTGDAPMSPHLTMRNHQDTKDPATISRLPCAPFCEDAAKPVVRYRVEDRCEDSQQATALASNAQAALNTDDDEVDTRDASPSPLPLHHQMTDLRARRRSEAAVFARGSGPGSIPRLTLSAFRRPEQTIRLTQADPRRSLVAEYDLLGCKALGHGAFSTVRLASRRRDSRQVAIKTIAKHEALRSRRLRVGGRRYLEEWEILRRFQNHPYIISLLDVFETEEEVQLVMEYCAGGELFDAIQKKRNRGQAIRRGQYTESQAALITSQILQALADLHAIGIAHRDVKAENILLTGSTDEASLHVKLCDFGVARSVNADNECPSLVSGGDMSPVTPAKSRRFSVVGSNYYMAPEVLCGEKYSTAIDVYSLGVTLYILLCGFPPVFSGGDNAAEVIFPSTFWKDISKEAKDLVREMLNPDPVTRIAARRGLSHPWLTNRSTSRPSRKRRRSTNTDCGNSNLDLVRSHLAKSLPQPRLQRSASAIATRKRFRRASISLMALADLCRGVTATPSLRSSTSSDCDSGNAHRSSSSSMIGSFGGGRSQAMANDKRDPSLTTSPPGISLSLTT